MVWYVSYGSVMDDERLRAYMEGSAGPEGVIVPPMVDRRRPIDHANVTLPYALYFGGWFRAWGGTASVFIDPDVAGGTPARAYLLRWGQFVELYQRENHVADVPLRYFPDMRAALAGNVSVRGAPYGRIVPLDAVDGTPALTFTSAVPQRLGQPARTYLHYIARGFRVAYPDVPAEEVAVYFAGLPGIDGNVSRAEIDQIVFGCLEDTP
jgi:hypothetical protein